LTSTQASKTFEYCAREASQIFGGAAIVREGQGKVVERQYRSVRASAIPGGSEEILLDFAIRQVAAKAAQLQSKM
jgi:alkylation response protein AidB-like acyl-CoA dehydrogenase